MSRRAVLVAFGAAVALFVVQVVLIGSGLGEPYPGIMMPAFTRSGGEAGGAVTTPAMLVAFIGHDDTVLVSRRRLFEHAPDSHHIMMSLRLHPDAVPGRAALLCAPDLREWLRKRIGEIAPGARPLAVEFRWIEETRPVGDPDRVSASLPAGTVRIPLDGSQPCRP